MTTVPKNSVEEIRITIGEYRGGKVLNIRKWWRNSGGEWRPGKDGIAMRADLAEDIVAAIQTEIDREGVS